MKFQLLTIAAILSLSLFNSCKKDVPGYCTESFFQEIQTADMAGNPTTTFSNSEDIVVNMPFTNTSSDSVFVNYSDPWVEYIIEFDGAELFSTASLTNGSGLKTEAVPAGGSVDGTLIIPGGVTPGNTTLTIRARAYYQYMRECDQGVQVEEKEIDITIN